MPQLFQDTLSPSELNQLNTLLSRASALKITSAFNFKADWLLVGGEGYPIWKTKNGGKEKCINSKWTNTADVSFAIDLPDNSNLMDVKNENLLKLIQRWSFMLRSGAFSSIIGPTVWASYTHFGLRFVYWLIDNDPELKTREFGFELLSQDALVGLMSKLAEDNWSEAFNSTDKIIKGLLRHSEIDEETLKFQDPYKLDEALVTKICAMIRKHEGYRFFYGPKKLEFVSRKWLAAAVGLPFEVLYQSSRISALLRQFEPLYKHPTLLLTYKRHRLYPSQNCIFFSEALAQTAAHDTYKTNATRLASLLNTASRFPDLIGILPQLDIKEASKAFENQTRARTHHNLMPIGTGLFLLDQALKWIIEYGEYIVNVAINFTKSSSKYRESQEWAVDSDYIRTAKLNNALLLHCESASEAFPAAHCDLAISTRNTKHRERHINFSLKNSVHVLIGACAYVIASLKPSRYAEIQGLNRNCIITSSVFLEKEVNYWLWHEMGKSGLLGRNLEGASPIPEIAVTAIKLLQRLGGAFTEAFNDNSKNSEKLFYAPIGLDWGQPEESKKPQSLNVYLDKFCDSVESPIDEHGRRWYARVHELRKLFIITLFWHGKYHTLDAARYVAGHLALNHTLNYVETNVPGDEISQIEAEYIDDRLIRLEQNKIDAQHHAGLCQLYKEVCSNFGVTNIECIPEKQYFSYLIQLRASGIYDIKPVLIEQKNEQEIIQFEIAVIYGEVYDENYYS